MQRQTFLLRATRCLRWVCELNCKSCSCLQLKNQPSEPERVVQHSCNPSPWSLDATKMHHQTVISIHIHFMGKYTRRLNCYDWQLRPFCSFVDYSNLFVIVSCEIITPSPWVEFHYGNNGPRWNVKKHDLLLLFSPLTTKNTPCHFSGSSNANHSTAPPEWQHRPTQRSCTLRVEEEWWGGGRQW